MVRKWLSYLLIALIAMQSVIAIADAHQLHQSGDQHLEFDHEHGSSTPDRGQYDEKEPNPSLSSDIKGTDARYDCHHCCHCHGVAHFFMAGGNVHLDIVSLGQETSDYHFAFPSALLAPDLRPPIA